MPTYEYVCHACGKEFELFQSMKDAPITHCSCGAEGKVRRKIGSGAGLIFKGSGFYETDYKRAPAPSGEGKPAATGSSGEGSAPAPAPAAKPPATPAPAAKPAASPSGS